MRSLMWKTDMKTGTNTPIIIPDNFLSVEECNKLIEFYKSQPTPEKYYTSYPILLIPKEHKSLTEKITKFSMKVNNSMIDYFHIVKWPYSNLGQELHLDVPVDKITLSSIIYLNDDYEGGYTYFKDGTRIAPVVGRAIFFDGCNYSHGVSHIDKNDRYTIAIWMKKIQ